jgi:hypothetical protein
MTFENKIVSTATRRYSINAPCALLTSRYLKYDTNFKYYLLERTRLVAVETILFSNVIKDAVIVDEPGLLFRSFKVFGSINTKASKQDSQNRL